MCPEDWEANLKASQKPGTHTHTIYSGLQKYSAPPSQYFVEPPFAAIIHASLLGYFSTSFTHLETEIFAHSSLQNSSNSVRLEGEDLWTAVFRSCHRFPLGFRSGLNPNGMNMNMFCFQPFYCSSGFMFRVVVLLEGELPPQPQVCV